MNFFEHQAQAERKTFRLVIYYLLGLFLTFLAIHAIITGVVVIATDDLRVYDFQSQDDGSAGYDETRSGGEYDESGAPGYDFVEAFVEQYFNPELLLIDLIAVILVIGGGTLYKTSQLKRMDGDGIAQMYGGVRVQDRGASWKERRLLNIVEEMAIASGIHVPNVYVLRNESGINAFAAGYSEPTSVVAVTQGALDYLARRTGRRDRARVQPYPSSGHAAEYAPDRNPFRTRNDRDDRLCHSPFDAERHRQPGRQ